MRRTAEPAYRAALERDTAGKAHAHVRAGALFQTLRAMADADRAGRTMARHRHAAAEAFAGHGHGPYSAATRSDAMAFIALCIASAASRPSLIAQTTSEAPRTMSPAARSEERRV